MSDKAFFDTNVLVYAFDEFDPSRREMAQALLDEALREGAAVVSLQVLQEFYVVVTRKIRRPLDPAVARALVASFLCHEVVEPTGLHLLQAIDVSQTRKTSFWDALILVAASAAGCKVVYSEDLSAGSVIKGVRVVNPFVR